MKERYWLSKRGRTFYSLDSVTRERKSLATTDRQEARRIIQARNESTRRPTFGFALAKTYTAAYDQSLVERTWQFVMDEYCSHGQPQTEELRRRKLKHKTFTRLRQKRLIETTSEDFVSVMRVRSVFVHGVLRNLQNLAVGIGWLPWPVLAPKLWPKLTSAPKRAITPEEHARIHHRPLALAPPPHARVFLPHLHHILVGRVALRPPVQLVGRALRARHTFALARGSGRGWPKAG